MTKSEVAILRDSTFHEKKSLPFVKKSRDPDPMGEIPYIGGKISVSTSTDPRPADILQPPLNNPKINRHNL